MFELSVISRVSSGNPLKRCMTSLLPAVKLVTS